MSDQHAAEGATYTTHNKHNRRTSMPSAVSEHTIPAVKRQQTYTLECTTIAIGLTNTCTAS